MTPSEFYEKYWLVNGKQPPKLSDEEKEFLDMAFKHPHQSELGYDKDYENAMEWKNKKTNMIISSELTVSGGNKIIALYMGWEANRFENLPNKLHRIKGAELIGISLDHLEYHSSWDALMEVVDDIYYSRRFPTGAQSKEVSSRSHRLWLEIKNGLVNLSKEQVWQAVVQFIKWFNINNKK